MAGILSGLLTLLGRGKASKSKRAVDGLYEELRQRVLTIEPGSIGLDSSPPDRVCAVLMETGYAEAVVTLVAIADGTVSLYFSNGETIIGVGQHEEPREAGRALLAASQTFLGQARQTDEFPLPEAGHTRFYFMTVGGTYTADALEDDLGGNKHPLSPLFYKAQAVEAQVRLMVEEWKRTTEALLRAAKSGDTKALRSMVESGTPVDAADETGLTPLMAASYLGMTEALEVLLDLGAEIDATDSDGYTALMFACNAGRTACARLLVERGADVNYGDNDSSTPIMFAAQYGHNEIVHLLLAKGADPQVQGSHGLSAIGFARQNKHAETERILTRKE